jgi:hypothetical protein
VPRDQRDPEGVLTALCGRLGIPFLKEQLQWKAGPKVCMSRKYLHHHMGSTVALPSSHSLLLLPVKQPFDGIWASFWYDQVHRTTGFDSTEDGPTISQSRGLRPFPPDLLPLLRLCSPFYEALRAYAIKPHDRSGCVPLY